MVMATGSLCQQYGTGDLPHEVAEGAGAAAAAAAAEAAALHERLVAYVHALAPPHEARSGVWVEHSYARARGAAHAPASLARVLLAPPRPASPAAPDVERVESPPEPPESRAASPSDDDDDDDERDWEPRVGALAPGAAHAALAERALDALRRLRLARLAGGSAREHERAAARRLRHALAAAAAAPGAAAQRPGPWLHAALLAYMPRAVRRLYDAVTAELHRSAPRLAERLTGGRAPPGRAPPAGAGPAVGAEAGVWLVWLGGGSERQDRRWRRRLGALLHTRLVAAPAAGAARPDVWCAAVAGAVRAALQDALAEAGERAVILGGAGMGAALCLALAGSAGAGGASAGGATPARPRGLLLLAPPLLTAEGARDAPDDPLGELRLPMLLVAGSGAAQSWRGAVAAVAGAGGAGARRVLEVRGADDALRAPRALRLRRRLPQHALDAAIAEECARWALETAEGGAGGGGASPPRAPRRRAAPPAPDAEDAALPPRAAGARADGAEAGGSPAGAGRVVSRGSGATPLALLPPRRAAPAPPAPRAPPALAAADIMRLPIVFADDEPAGQFRADGEADAADGAVTVTSGDSAPGGAAWRGAAPYARVIVASRGAAGRGAAARGAGARPLLLRRAVRLVARAGPAPR